MAIEITSAVLASVETTTSLPNKNGDESESSLNALREVNPTRVTLSQEGKALVTADKKSSTDTGYTTLLSRLFRISDPLSEPAVETKWTLSSMQNPIFAFLTKDDRQTVARAYQYVKDNNIDLSQVDNFAYDLSTYRDFQAEGTNLETLPGNGWNTDGSPRYYRMPNSDTKTATRILQSKEASQTSIDHGFIAFILNPRGHGWVNENNSGHAVDFGFLEKLIKETSPYQEVKADSKPAAGQSSIEPLYKNSLYWLNHQNIPDLPPEGWKSPDNVSNIAPTLEPTASTNEDLSKAYRVGFLALLDGSQRKSKPAKDSNGDKVINQTAQKTFAQTQLEELLKNEALQIKKT